MDELNLQVLQGFGLKPRGIVKHKLFYLCNTDKGTKIVRKFVSDGEKTKQSLLFQHYIKENLYAGGYPFLDRFHLSLKNEPYFMTEKYLYVVTDCLPFREANFALTADFIKVVEGAAALHALAKAIPLYGDGYPPQKTDSRGKYEHSALKLAAMKKTVAKTRQLSDFDVLFYKHYDYYRDCLERWFALCADSDLDRASREAAETGQLCHNLLKEEYLPIHKNDVYITNFSECAYDYALKDLAALIKRHFKAIPETPLAAARIVEIYHKINPLSSRDIERLYALLLFPDQFLKICTQYYTKKRTWIPGTFQTRIERVIQTKDAYMRYIDAIDRK